VFCSLTFVFCSLTFAFFTHFRILFTHFRVFHSLLRFVHSLLLTFAFCSLTFQLTFAFCSLTFAFCSLRQLTFASREVPKSPLLVLALGAATGRRTYHQRPHIWQLAAQDLCDGESCVLVPNSSHLLFRNGFSKYVLLAVGIVPKN